MIFLLADEGIIGIRKVEALVGIDLVVRWRAAILFFGMISKQDTYSSIHLQFGEILIAQCVPVVLLERLELDALILRLRETSFRRSVIVVHRSRRDRSRWAELARQAVL